MLRRIIAFGFLSACWLAAQGVNGSITGTVVDTTGTVCVGATVKLTSELTGAVQTESTNAEGNFVFAAVLPSIYKVSVVHPGFKLLQKEHIELTPGDHLDVGSLKLDVGAVTDSVTVAAEGAMLQTATS